MPQAKSSSPRKPTLAVDFDGVVHAYTRGWQDGSCYDEPTAGCREALLKLRQRYVLVLFTARHDLDAVRKWLLQRGMLHLFKDVTNRKPAAVAYLDDRAVRFTDWDTAVTDLYAV